MRSRAGAYGALYPTLHAGRLSETKQRQHGWRRGSDGKRVRQNGDRNYLADHVSSGSSPWQGKCSVDMAIFHFTHPGVVGQGTISGVSIVQEAVGIRALISQH